MARVIVRSRDREAAEAFAHKLVDVFNQALTRVTGEDSSVRLLGPAEAPVFRLKGYYRYHFQLQSPSAGALHHVLRHVLPAAKTPTGVECTVDIDPLAML
jgi:primosomal protein N' (replication factor Y)